MVESILRVEKITHFVGDNPFYGKAVKKMVYEESFISEKDERENLAPCGVCFELNMKSPLNENGDTTLLVKAERGILNYECSELFDFTFNLDTDVYDVNVVIDELGIADLWVNRWYDEFSFEKGEDADETYEIGEIKIFTKLDK